MVDGDKLGDSLKSLDGDIDNTPDGMTLGESLNASVGVKDGATLGESLNTSVGAKDGVTLGLSVDGKVGNKVGQDDRDSESNLLGGCEKDFLFCVGFEVTIWVGVFVVALIALEGCGVGGTVDLVTEGWGVGDFVFIGMNGVGAEVAGFDLHCTFDKFILQESEFRSQERPKPPRNMFKCFAKTSSIESLLHEGAKQRGKSINSLRIVTSPALDTGSTSFRASLRTAPGTVKSATMSKEQSCPPFSRHKFS